MYVRQVDRGERVEVARAGGQEAQHISHQSDIDRRRKGQGGGTDSLVTFKEEKKTKRTETILDTAGGRQLKKKSKGEYKYIGDQMKTVDEKKRWGEFPVE